MVGVRSLIVINDADDEEEMLRRIRKRRSRSASE